MDTLKNSISLPRYVAEDDVMIITQAKGFADEYPAIKALEHWAECDHGRRTDINALVTSLKDCFTDHHSELMQTKQQELDLLYTSAKRYLCNVHPALQKIDSVVFDASYNDDNDSVVIESQGEGHLSVYSVSGSDLDFWCDNQ